MQNAPKSHPITKRHIMASVLLASGMLCLSGPAAAQTRDTASISAVGFNDGQIVRVSGGAWVESLNNGMQFTFDEIPSTDGFIYLLDTTRNVQLAIDPTANLIYFSEQQQPFEQIYQVTFMNASTAPVPNMQPSLGQVVYYSCNEGIPLVVRYDNSQEIPYAEISHDSSPWYRLKSAISGSGARYEANGVELHSDDVSALVSFNGSEDSCMKM